MKRKIKNIKYRGLIISLDTHILRKQTTYFCKCLFFVEYSTVNHEDALLYLKKDIDNLLDKRLKNYKELAKVIEDVYNSTSHIFSGLNEDILKVLIDNFRKNKIR